MSESKSKGLRLTLGGAPNVPHMIPGVPGVFRPDSPTPVGGPGELDEQFAQQVSDDKSIPLELVEIPKGKVDEARKTADRDLMEARQGLLDDARARRLAGREQDRARELAASVNVNATPGQEG